MSEKRELLGGNANLLILIFFGILFALSATATIWQWVSKANNGGVSSVFNYVAVQTNDNEFYVFSKCNPEEVVFDELVAYNKSSESNSVQVSIGKFKEIIEDSPFDKIKVVDVKTSEEVIRPVSYFVGTYSDNNHFSYLMVSLLNSDIMLWLFALPSLCVLIITSLIIVKKNKKEGGKKLSKREKKLAEIIKK